MNIASECSADMHFIPNDSINMHRMRFYFHFYHISEYRINVVLSLFSSWFTRVCSIRAYIGFNKSGSSYPSLFLVADFDLSPFKGEHHLNFLNLKSSLGTYQKRKESTSTRL